MTPQQDGCLCGGIRYAVATPPPWVAACYCRFCQRASGAPGMVEPVFETGSFAVSRGAPPGPAVPDEGLRLH